LPEPTTVSSDDGATANSSSEWRAAAEKRIAEAKEQAAKLKAEAQERQAQHQKVSEKLSDVRQKTCEKHHTVITNVMNRINDRGQRRLNVVNTVSTRVQDFKAGKGLAVNDYDALVAAVDSSKTNAQTAIDMVKSTQVEFKCDGSNPKGVGASYQQAVKTQNEALKSYRDAVKDLVVAVKQAAQNEEQN